MLFNFDCQRILETNPDGFSILEGSYSKAIKPSYILFVNQVLDSMGYASSKVYFLNKKKGSRFINNNYNC